jgi:hypothetical protein
MGVSGLQGSLQSGCLMEQLLEPKFVDLVDGDEEELIVFGPIAERLLKL